MLQVPKTIHTPWRHSNPRSSVLLAETMTTTTHRKGRNYSFFYYGTLDWKMLKYLMAIWNIFQTFGIFYDHLVHFVFISNFCSGFGIMYIPRKIWQPCLRVWQRVKKKIGNQRNAKSRVLAGRMSIVVHCVEMFSRPNQRWPKKWAGTPINQFTAI
jgi:hypothetical protein